MLTAQQVVDTYRATRLPAGPTAAQKSELSKIAAMLLKGEVAGANARWARLCNTYITRATARDVPAIERWVLHQAYFRANSALQAALREWEQKLDSVGDDAQLANIDLQNVLQKQQQTIQMLSNVSKVLSDTALAVIRKIG